ncbi:hypothetical protein Tco_1217782 [Tanacetum coccineum]
MKLNEVKKFCDGTLLKIRDNFLEMVNKNELGRGNKRLKGKDWSNKDIKRLNEMLEKIDKTLSTVQLTGLKIPSEEVSLELLTEMSGKGIKWVLTIDDQKRMHDDLNDTMREVGIPKKPALVIQSCERDTNAPPIVVVNKNIFYMKNGNSKTRKCVLSLHKIHAFAFLENDLEELNTRYVRKPIKRCNIYARYVVEHWKNLWAKQSYIRGQLKKRADPDEVYSYQRIVDVIRVQYDQGHGQEFMKECVVKRADGEYESFSESDYKYLHKNDIKDMYLMWLNEEKKPYTSNSLPFIGLIYENSKKEKRIMDIDEILKFCDATLKRVLKEVKKINLDVKHADPTLSKDDA